MELGRHYSDLYGTYVHFKVDETGEVWAAIQYSGEDWWRCDPFNHPTTWILGIDLVMKAVDKLRWTQI